MINNIRKIIVRVAVMSVMLAILSYIFWPQSKTVVTIEPTPTTMTTLAIVADPPCLVLYQKDKDVTALEETACVSTYVDKYKAGYYSILNVVCRSSSDGQNINRNDLSEKRTKALQFVLLEKGIAYTDIVTKSLGDTSPYPGIDPESADGKILNRSCEITGTIR
jgi:outer membrane protein OmpA-like peptidoglycan-associated protein